MSEVNRKPAKFFLKIILPAVVTMALFIVAIFQIIIPSFRKAMLMEKKEMIRELSETAWSILNEQYELQLKGDFTEQQAQARAIAEIRGLRYGRDMKDYFWICDMKPKMVVHPYRPELDGKDLTNFKDPHNKRVFVEFVDVVNKKKEGFVEYYWQWKDDSERIVPKLSYVKEFEPWRWIIGTGIYLEDVEQEINGISNRIISISIQIALVSILLMLVVIYHSHTIEKERHISQLELKQARDKYQALIESSSEAFILIVGNKMNYANSAALKLLKCNEAEFLKLEVTDIISKDLTDDRKKLQKLLDEQIEDAQLESELLRQDDTTVPAVFSISQVLLGERRGFIIIVKEISPEKMKSRLARQRRLAEEQKKILADLHNTQRLSGEPLPDWSKAAQTSSVEELIKLRLGFPAKLKSLIDSGIKVENLTGINTRMSDAVNCRFIELAIEEIGEPPTPFSFIVYGSQGRNEQTLKTDQDNGIIFQVPEKGEDLEEIRAYFLKLGAKVCYWLQEAGYPYCGDNNMANNKKCVLTLEEWKTCFNNWIFNATPNNILRVNIYFDFRSLYGKSELVDELWQDVHDTIDGRPEFLMHFVEDALLYKPPITLFGNIATKGKGEKKETVSMKEVISAIVQFGRIYALKNRVHETNTIERLRELMEKGLLKESTFRETMEVYDLLMSIRFKYQAKAMDNGDAPNNQINPKKLTEIEREILKKAFTGISNLQAKISYDFKGSI